MVKSKDEIDRDPVLQWRSGWFWGFIVGTLAAAWGSETTLPGESPGGRALVAAGIVLVGAGVVLALSVWINRRQ